MFGQAICKQYKDKIIYLYFTSQFKVLVYDML